MESWKKILGQEWGGLGKGLQITRRVGLMSKRDEKRDTGDNLGSGNLICER